MSKSHATLLTRGLTLHREFKNHLLDRASVYIWYSCQWYFAMPVQLTPNPDSTLNMYFTTCKIEPNAMLAPVRLEVKLPLQNFILEIMKRSSVNYKL